MNPPHGIDSLAKRSLNHFAIGRIASAIIGVTTLLLLVRSLSRDNYGIYITLFAAFEILQLMASPGAYAIAFRYLPELRPVGGGIGLQSLVRGVTAYRAASLVLFSTILFVATPQLVQLAGANFTPNLLRLFALLLCFEGMARFIDVEFESLLQQGKAQASALFRNSAKLLTLLFVSKAGQQTVTLELWLCVEVVTSAVGAVMSTGLLLHYSSQRARESVVQTLHPPALTRQLRFCVPTYFSQALYLLTGTEMVKLLISRLMGAQVIAAFGFASALSATIQKYLPSYLLIGWVRPLFISARSSGRSTADLVRLGGTVIKINFLTLAPIATALQVAGEPLLALVSGGRMTDGIAYLYFFVALLFVQSIRTVISLLGFTMEIGSGSLVATLFSVVGIALGVALYPKFGIWSLCAGLVLSELSWTVVMVCYLSTRGMKFSLPWLSLAKFCAAILVSTELLHAFGFGDLANEGNVDMAIVLVFSAAACLAFCSLLRPFSSEERVLINKLLPMNIFIW